MTLARSFYNTQTTAYDYLQARAPRELWSAVLQQAIADITEGPSALELRHMTLAEMHQARRDIQVAAQHWVDDEVNEPRRFVWVCEQLGMEPAAVRAEIVRRQREAVELTSAATRT